MRLTEEIRRAPVDMFNIPLLTTGFIHPRPQAVVLGVLPSTVAPARSNENTSSRKLLSFWNAAG